MKCSRCPRWVSDEGPVDPVDWLWQAAQWFVWLCSVLFNWDWASFLFQQFASQFRSWSSRNTNLFFQQVSPQENGCRSLLTIRKQIVLYVCKQNVVLQAKRVHRRASIHSMEASKQFDAEMEETVQRNCLVSARRPFFLLQEIRGRLQRWWPNVKYKRRIQAWSSTNWVTNSGIRRLQ